MCKPQLLSLFLLLLFACQPTDNSNEVETGIDSETTTEEEPLLEIDLSTIQEEGALDSARLVNVSYDPVLQKPKKYQAIPLRPYLEKLVATQRLDTSNTEIIFLCKDGYNPSMSLGKVLANEPYLAVKDLDATEGKNWADTLQGKWSPFYLVWTNHSEGAKDFSWPYGLAYLQFKTSDAAYKAAFPADDNQIAGFELYKNKCMKCHSVNMVGGIMGPELNIPKNITEYWKIEDIKAFVKNPYAYRYNSKMPPVLDIKDQEIDVIINYLTYLKDYKIPVE